MHGDIAATEVYQLRIALRDLSPAIWRRAWVRADSTIADLHDTLQLLMGGTDSHLNRFILHGQHTASPTTVGAASRMTRAR